MLGAMYAGRPLGWIEIIEFDMTGLSWFITSTRS